MLLEFEEITPYLHYNAKCEFFSSGSFPPNPECRDAHCLARQKELAAGKASWLKGRKDRVAKRKEAKAKTAGLAEEDAVDPDEWGIELVGESEAKKDVFLDAKEAAGATLEDLMGKMKELSFGGAIKEGK